MSPDLLAEAVRKHGGLVHNCHPSSTLEGKDQWDYRPAHYSVINNTEMYGDVIHYEGKTYDAKMEQAVRGFLDLGGKTGFVRGTDTHEGQPAARTAVLAREFTREAIFEALGHRRNYAVSEARILLSFKINGHEMGEEIEIAGKPQIDVDIHGTDMIEEAIIVRDGATLHSLSPGTENLKFTYVDESFRKSSYYYLRVTQVDKDRHGNLSRAWSSPIWVKSDAAENNPPADIGDRRRNSADRADQVD